MLLSGCLSKENDFISKYCPGSCTVISGRLTTDGGATPLAHVKVDVNWQWRGTLGIGGMNRRKATTTTDADGRYELRFLLRDDELTDHSYNSYITVIAALNPDKYFTLYDYESIVEPYITMKRDTSYSADYTFPQKAFVELQLRNTAAMQPEDQFITAFVFSGGQNNAQNLGSMLYWNKETPATTLTVPVAANQQVLIRIKKTKNGVETITETPLRLKPGQHTTFEATF